MKKLLEIKVACLEAYDVKGKRKTVNMVPFTAEASGEYFTGKTMGVSVDTQTYEEGKIGKLSARYMLEGNDFTGAKCRVYIENNTCDDGVLRPAIVTDSRALSDWEEKTLRATLEVVEGGVIIKVFEE